MREITWIAETGSSKTHNRSGSGVGYTVGARGQRLYVRYTMSESIHRCRRDDAITLLAAMARDEWTGAATLAHADRV